MLKSPSTHTSHIFCRPVSNSTSLNNLQIPLPPLAEQRRIVAKIDELMARCDELEKLKIERDRKQITVHKSALNRLLTAKDHSDFQTSWHFITQHFSELYSVKENVAELRKAILQLAVMGKLVPQDPSDQPASELLKDIEKEKQKLIKEGKIKASKPLPEIKPDEIPYNLPKSWECVRLGQITNIVRGGSPRPAGDPRFYDGHIPFLKVADLTAENEMYLSKYTYSIKEAGLHKTRMVPPDTLMLTNSGATLGVPKICTFQTTFNDGIAAFIFMNTELYKPFFYYFLSSKTYYFLHEASRGQGQPNLNTEIIGETIVGLPPLAEQHRIVAKIDQLMTLCDELEKQIDAAESKQTNLLNSLMAKV
nr:restriction endonuclease subunit S [Pseudanabaena cinerea]